MKIIILFAVCLMFLLSNNIYSVLYQLDRYDDTITTWSYSDREQNGEFSVSRISRTKHVWKNSILNLLLKIEKNEYDTFIELKLIKTAVRNKNRHSSIPSIIGNNILFEFDDGSRYLVYGTAFNSAFRFSGQDANLVANLLSKHNHVRIKITISHNIIMAFNVELIDFPCENTLEFTQDVFQISQFQDTSKTFIPLSIRDFINIEYASINSSSIEQKCLELGYKIVKIQTSAGLEDSKKNEKRVFWGYHLVYDGLWIPLSKNYSGLEFLYENDNIQEITFCYNDISQVKRFISEAQKLGLMGNVLHINNHSLVMSISGNLIKCKVN